MTTSNITSGVTTQSEQNLAKILNYVFTQYGIGKQFSVSNLGKWLKKNKITSSLFYNFVEPGVIERVARGKYVLREYSDAAINKGAEYWKKYTQDHSKIKKEKNITKKLEKKLVTVQPIMAHVNSVLQQSSEDVRAYPSEEEIQVALAILKATKGDYTVQKLTINYEKLF